MKSLNLLVSNKSVVVASSSRLEKALKTAFLNTGIKCKFSSGAKYLGTTFHAATHINVSKTICLKRFKSSKHRIDRIKRICKINRYARRLFSTGAMPQSLYSHESVGVAQTHVHALRVSAGACSGINSSCRCLTTAIFIAYGPRGDPWHKIIAESVNTFFKLFYNCSSDNAERLRSAWPDARDSISVVASKDRHRYVRGPLTNMIYLLYNLGWNPIGYNHWLAPDGLQWFIPKHPSSTTPIIHALQNSASNILWGSASKHYEGGGLEQGFDYEASMAWLNKLRGKGPKEQEESLEDQDEEGEGDYNKYKVAALLETVMAAGAWSPERIHNSNPNINTYCPMCKDFLNPSDIQTYWTCPALLRLSLIHI